MLQQESSRGEPEDIARHNWTTIAVSASYTEDDGHDRKVSAMPYALSELSIEQIA